MPEIWFPNLGIEIAHLDRVAFTILGKPVYWYCIFIGIGLLIGLGMAMKEAKRTGQNPEMYLDFVLYAMVAAIIGARAYYVLFSWDFYSAHPEKIFAIREGGLAIYGGVCLISGVTVDQIEKKWDKILDKTEDRINTVIFGRPKERVIEVEYEEVT